MGAAGTAVNADSFFTIGSRHTAQGTPCEDYAYASAASADFAWAAVADGCSGALASTDIGARALVHAFEHTVAARAGASGAWFEGEFLAELAAALRARCITDRPADYYATLAAVAGGAQRAEVLVLGDGVLAVCFVDGRCRLRWTEWPCNAPFYFAYRLDGGASAAYLERYRGEVVEHCLEFVLGQPQAAVASTRILAEAEYREGQRFVFEPENEGIAGIALFTDGLDQIGGTSIAQAADACLGFKSFRGSFVKRRLINAVKTFARAGAVARDDLAVAALWYVDPAAALE